MTNLESEVETHLSSFGTRLRELRLRRGWKLQDLADRSGLSKTFLSRLESGNRQASIAAVLTLSRIFEVSLSFFFESPLALEPCLIVRRADAEERSVNGLKYKPLSNAGRFSRLQPLFVRVSPSRRGTQHFQHQGEEWIYVLSGKLILSLAGRTYSLGPGDAAHFESRLAHRLVAPGPEEAQVLVVASPDSNANYPSLFLEHRAIPDMAAIAVPKQRRIAASGTPGKKANLRKPGKETYE